MKLIRKPSQVGLPTSVGFATSAHAKCAFLVLQKVFAGLTAVEPGGHPADGRVAVNLSESTLMGQRVSILIFHRLTLIISSVRGLIDRLKVKFLEEINDDSSFVGLKIEQAPLPDLFFATGP